MVTTDVHLPPGEADLARALALVTARLRERFASVPATTVEDVVAELTHDFDGSRVRAFVPILVERLARDRLTVLSMPAPQADQA